MLQITELPVTSDLWDVSFEWGNWTTDWDINSTEIVTTEKPVIKPPETPPITGTRFCMAILMSLIIPVAILGNTAVLIAIAKTRSLQRPNTMMYLSLSIADVMRTVFCMPFFTYALFTNDWDIPEELCPFYHAFYIMVRFVTVLNLTVISLERLIIITRPLLYHRKATKTAMFRLIAIIWTISFLYGALNILWFFDLDGYIDRTTFKNVNIPCRFQPHVGFVIFDFILTFVIPLGIMFIVYAQIFLVVHSQMKKIQPHMQNYRDMEARETTFYKRPASSDTQRVPEHNSSSKINNGFTKHNTPQTKVIAPPTSNRELLVDNVYSKNAPSKEKTKHDLQGINKYDTLNGSAEHQQSSLIQISINYTAENNVNNSNSIKQSPDKNSSIHTICNEDTDNKHSKSELNDSHVNVSYDRPSFKSIRSVHPHKHENQKEEKSSVTSTEDQSTSEALRQNYFHQHQTGDCGDTNQQLNDSQNSNSSLNQIPLSANNNIHTTEDSQKLKSKPPQNKAIKLSIAVIGTFILCYAPYEISFLIEMACSSCIGDIAWMIVNTLAFLSAAVNPFVYSLYSTEFRSAMKKLITCC